MDTAVDRRLVERPSDREGDVDLIDVVVAGGRRLVRDALADLLGRQPDLVVAGNAGESLAVEALLARGRVDVVVTHVHLERPGGGARLAERLRGSHPDVGVVLLVGDSDPREVRRVLDGGTHGRALLVMDHLRCADDLPRAVREVAAGGSVVHPGVVDLILRADTGPTTGLSRLTAGERQVLRVLAEGASNQAIADRLGISGRAVEKRISQVYEKLDLPNDPELHRRVAAAMLARDLGPVDG